MKIPSTKDTIGCSNEVKQPAIPECPQMSIIVSGKQYTTYKDAVEAYMDWLGGPAQPYFITHHTMPL